MAECLPVSLAEKADCGNFHWKPTGKLKYEEKYKAGCSSPAAHRTDSCCWALHASAAEGKKGYQNVMRVSCAYNGYKDRQLSWCVERVEKRLSWYMLDHSLVFKVLYLEHKERNIRDSWISQIQQQMALALKIKLLLIFFRIW